MIQGGILLILASMSFLTSPEEERAHWPHQRALMPLETSEQDLTTQPGKNQLK